jgi:class 3 adenylate cyclase
MQGGRGRAVTPGRDLHPCAQNASAATASRLRAVPDRTVVFRTHPEQPFLVWRRCAPEGDTVWRMERFEALRERVLDRFEALGPIEMKGVAEPVPLFQTASS